LFNWIDIYRLPLRTIYCGANILERKLSDTALKIYVYLLESGEPRTVREIADALGIPHSSVHYHLKKLIDMGVIGRDPKGYIVKEKISIEGYIIIRNKLIPRLLLYSLFFLGVFLGDLILVGLDQSINPDRLISLIVSFIAFIVFFYESIRLRIL
jgi:DNA-binding transcriptional ArsR family regulator